MQIVVKLYDNIRSSDPYTQVFIEWAVEIEQDLMVFDTATFDLPLIEWIEKNQKLEIYEVNDVWNDTRVFSWYIYDLIPLWKNFGKVSVIARWEKALFDIRRLLFYKRFYEADFKVASLPVYPSWILHKTYFRGSTLFTLTWINIGDGWISNNRSPAISLVDTSFVFVDDTSELWKREWTVLTSQWIVSWLDIKLVLQDMLDDYNNNYWEARTLECDITQDIQIDLNLWDDYSSILNELADSLWAIRTIKDKVLRFQLKENFWIDRTDKTKDSYEEVVFNWEQPSESNISNVSRSSTEPRANILISKTGEYSKTINDSLFTDIVYWVVFKEFRQWDIANKSLAYIQWRNIDLNDYTFEIEQNTIMWNVGDKIKLFIEGTNSFFDINTDTYIVGKNILYDKWKVESFKFQEVPTISVNVVNYGRNIEKQIKFNQVK